MDKKKKAFSLKENKVKGEYWGNEESGKVVIFSHGFGVKRDSRGMFSELARLLQDDYLVVLFDYVDVDDEGNTTAYPFSEQAKKLESVIEYIRRQFGSTEIDIVAHSQGCVITGLVSPDNIYKVLLVAGPTSAPGEKMKEYFSQREGTEINERAVSKIKRSDRTLTFIPSEYWREAAEAKPTEMYLRLSEKSRVYFIRAMQDQVVTGESYTSITSNPSIKYIELNGNHDFEGKDRKPWLTKMTSILRPS